MRTGCIVPSEVAIQKLEKEALRENRQGSSNQAGWPQAQAKPVLT
jgi:hypothetical protein